MMSHVTCGAGCGELEELHATLSDADKAMARDLMRVRLTFRGARSSAAAACAGGFRWGNSAPPDLHRSRAKQSLFGFEHFQEHPRSSIGGANAGRAQADGFYGARDRIDLDGVPFPEGLIDGERERAK
jgi:hypothetical protein